MKMLLNICHKSDFDDVGEKGETGGDWPQKSWGAEEDGRGL